MFFVSRRSSLLFSIGLALVSGVAVWLGVRAVASATDVTPPAEASSPAAPTQASLHNPTFDNHFWYEFHKRYQGAYFHGAWLPDDDTPGGPQDWRLWFLDGTAIVDTDPEETFAHSVEGVQIRPYEWGKTHDQVAGLYQVIYGATPCLVYEFQMYGQARPEDPGDDRDADLKVGIDQAGWHPDSASDPAVHGAFPSTTVWGPAHNNKFAYAPLTVTAEALSTTITVYTFGDAPGGRYHRVLWDTGSFRDVTPAMIYDPDDPSTPSGISNLQIVTGSHAVTVTWTTANAALGQAYYRSLSVTGTMTTTYTNTVYLPLVMGAGAGWQASPLDKTPTTAHTAIFAGLGSDRSYELVVAARGLSGEQCATWVSEERTFKTEQ